MRSLVAITMVAAVVGQDAPNCFAKPADACADLLWASENNKTMCLVPSPPAFISKAESKHCCGLGLGCPSDYDGGGRKLSVVVATAVPRGALLLRPNL